MNQTLDRTLDVLADGEPVIGFGRAWLSGKDRLGLFPDPFMLRLWNLGEEDYLLLSRAKEISVSHEGSVLASGTLADVFRRASREGTVAYACFSPGLKLWEAPVSLSVEAGTPVSETVRRLLEASGTGIRLLSFPGRDPAAARGRAFFGRAAECMEEALSACGAWAYLTPSGLCAVPDTGLPVSLTLSETDLLDAPAFPSGSLMVLRTKVTGWLPGKAFTLSWDGREITGLITERSVEADTASGPWQAELLAEVA